MVAMTDEAVGKRRRYREPPARGSTLRCAHFVKNGCVHFVKNRYRLMAVTSMNATFNKLSVYLFCVQDHLTYAILKFYFTYILNWLFCICSICPFDKTNIVYI